MKANNIKPYRQAVMAIIIKEDHSFLIGSSPRDGGYKFPQGGLEENEEHLDGLIREIKEELGTDLGVKDVICKLTKSVKYAYPSHKPYSQIYLGQELHVFIIRHRETMTFTPQDDEFDELHWIKRSELTNFDFHHRKEAYFSALNQFFDGAK